MIDLSPPPPQQTPIIVHTASTGAPMVLLGFIVYGTDAQLKQVEAAAQAAGVKSGRVDEPTKDGSLELMVVFQPGYDRTRGFDLYHRAMRGDFGTRNVNAMVVTTADFEDNGGPDGDEIRVFDPGAIVD